MKKVAKIKIKKMKIDYLWIIKIFFISFVISMMFSLIAETVIRNVDMIFSVLIIILFIVIGVIFDMIGIAVAASEEKPFHSMNSKKLHGSDSAIFLIKNASKVSSFCNDVIGDISGIVSGSAGAVIALNLANRFNGNSFIYALVVTSLIASFTIGGKALGKSYAINHSEYIIYEFAKFISIFRRK